MAARQLIGTLVASIETAMLSERPDITRGLIDDLRRSTPVEGLDVYRRNGVEAFTDLATLREVSKEAELPKGVMASHREDARASRGRTMTGPLFTRALETLQTQESLESRDGADALHAVPADPQPGALPGLPRHGPQGARGRAGGHLHGAGDGRGAQAAQPPDLIGAPDHRGRGRRCWRWPCATWWCGRSTSWPRWPAASARATSRCGPAPARATRWPSWAARSTT